MILLAATRGKTRLFDAPDGRLQNSFYYQSHNLENLVILDPFMGGGTTLVEANRVGAKVIGSDLNPVAYWIVRETLKPIDLQKLQRYFSQLERTAGERIKALYRTQSTVLPLVESDILYVFWVRYVDCPHCGTPVYLFKRYFLNRGASRNKPLSPQNQANVVCQQCLALNQFDGTGDNTCYRCGMILKPDTQTFNNGKCYCPTCHSEPFALIETVRDGSSLGNRMIAIEYYHPILKKRLYKEPDADDLEAYQQLERQFCKEFEQLRLPQQFIPEGSSSARWRAHSFLQYYQVFNARQIIAFNFLIQGIEMIPEGEYRNAFITAFSNSLEYNNMMTPYNYPHRKLHHLFTYHALPLTTTPVENSVWGLAREGAGTFVNCMHRYISAKTYCQHPYDKFKDGWGNIVTVNSKSEKIAVTQVDTFEALQNTPKAAILNCGDSSDLSFIPDHSVDAVITDPPYFDNIHYSELSNFFYVWLRQFDLGPIFQFEHVPMEQEAIVNLGQGKTESGYYELMRSVYQECWRVLKDDGTLMFTFHHSKSQAWWTLLFALRDSGFVIDDYFPVTSEYKVNPHVRGKDAIDLDLVIICKKRKTAFESGQLSFDLIAEGVKERLDTTGNGQLTESRVQFYFIGETLRVASRLQNLDIDVFEKTMRESAGFASRYVENLLSDPTYKQAQPMTYEQLRLLQQTTAYRPDED
jgi:adenine-specific DNA methylase